MKVQGYQLWVDFQFYFSRHLFIGNNTSLITHLFCWSCSRMSSSLVPHNQKCQKVLSLSFVISFQVFSLDYCLVYYGMIKKFTKKLHKFNWRTPIPSKVLWFLCPPKKRIESAESHGRRKQRGIIDISRISRYGNFL